MAEQDLDRSEAATPFKLHKAQERGQVPRSADVVSAAVFAGAMVFVAWQGLEAARATLRLSRFALLHLNPSDLDGPSLWALLASLGAQAGMLLLPLLAVLMAVAVLASVAQTGPVLSLEPVKIDIDRLNPVNGLKRVFSLRTLFDAARACAKLLVLCLAAWLALRSLLPQFHAIAGLPALEFLRVLVDDTADLGLKMAVALGLVAGADLLFTRREFSRNMRMSRRELKDEFKNREGDPRIRSRLRELRREMLKRSKALSSTRDADVVITNPTHYAVALRYVHGEMDAPRLVAKGAGKLAAAMREIAARHRVTVIQNPPLARQLFRETEIDQSIPHALHPQVARIIVWVFALREQRRSAYRGGPA